MKKIGLILLLCMTALFADAQNVFKLCYATSDDGFVNIRSTPSNSGKILGRVEELDGGLGDAVYLGKSGGWSKVKKGGVVGYAYTKYLGFDSWYSGGSTYIVALEGCPVYTESYGDSPVGSVLCKLKAGTIIADEYEDSGNYYYLSTAHDGLLVPKNKVRVVRH